MMMIDYANSMCNIFCNTGFAPLTDDALYGHVYRCTKQRYVRSATSCVVLYEEMSAEEFDKLFDLIWPQLIVKWVH